MASCSSDLASEVRELESQLENAERARIRPEDRRAQEIRIQLESKKYELRTAHDAESAIADEVRRAQDLEKLRSIGNDQHKAHALLLALRAESVELAARTALTEFHNNELLRAYSQLKQQLGV